MGFKLEIKIVLFTGYMYSLIDQWYKLIHGLGTNYDYIIKVHGQDCSL